MPVAKLSSNNAANEKIGGPGSTSLFSFLIFVVVGLAVVLPQPFSENEFLYGGGLARFSVAIIFFLQGLSLPTRSLINGYRPLRLHRFILFWNFIGFPVVTFLLFFPVARIVPTELLLGFAVLAFLPTTIASATAYTALSDGCVANAIVATALSSLLAVFVVPAVSFIYFRMELSIDVPLSKVLLNLIYILVIPLVMGQIAQRLFQCNMPGTAKISKKVSAGLILCIVYLAFVKSMNSGIFEKFSFISLAMTLFAVVLLLLVTSVFVWLSAFWMQFTMSQRIAAFYCGSQKSLAAGLPLVSSVLLSIPDLENTAMIFIPLLFFHPLQMALAGIAASRLKSRSNVKG